MCKPGRIILISLLVIMAVIPLGVNLAQAGPGTLAGTDASATPSGGTYYANSPLGVYRYCDAAGVCGTTTSNSGTALAKFVDKLPGLGSANANGLGQYIPVATPDTTTYAGSDYYQIGLKDYTQKMHTNLPKATKLRGYYQKNGTDHSTQYLGPLILAKTYDPTKTAGTAGNGKPVRIKFYNELGINGAGDLFIPVDTTFMGAGQGAKFDDGTDCDPQMQVCANYTQNRAVIHLHGGATPWISDGTPHQWITPSADSTPYKIGASQKNVPDMTPLPVAGDGTATYYYTNQQSGRLLWYHDHSYGTTRLNAYAGGAAGYLLYDQTEEDLIKGTNISGNNAGGTKPIPDNGLGVYTYGIPLIIQDKTFVPADIAVQDAKWTNAKWGASGDLWFPHIYETNQWPDNPDYSGANNFGRWDWGPWFWPPVVVDAAHSTPPVYEWDLSATPEAFMDTMVVNGTAYPYLPVSPQAYRFRILNGSNDRPLNLQMYVADPNATGAGVGKEVSMVAATPRPNCTASSIAATPTVPSICTCTAAYSPFGCFPDTWPTDGRAGGVPDPQFAGPKLIQIGTEGGFLPAPVVLANQPVGYEYNRRTIVVLDIKDQTLLLGPAERADVIIDFSAFGGKNIILYNDAPAPMPAFDPRYDYYTGDPDNTWMGGAPTTLAGYGPNTRTVMQFQVATGGGGTPYYDDAAKMITLTTAMKTAFNATQPKPIVPQTTYPAPNNVVNGAQYARIQDNSMTFTPIGASAKTTINFKPKAIQELWDPYGRMNATLGVELPFTNNNIQTTIPLGYVD
ncbi:MAG: copper oxidase, partial [Deltaproteobacteria bacterium]